MGLEVYFLVLLGKSFGGLAKEFKLCAIGKGIYV